MSTLKWDKNGKRSQGNVAGERCILLLNSSPELGHTTMGRSGETMQAIADTSASPNPLADQPRPFPFSKANWDNATAAVGAYILALVSILAEQQKAIDALQKRVEKREARLNHNSTNSSILLPRIHRFSRNGTKHIRVGQAIELDGTAGRVPMVSQNHKLQL